MKKQTATSGNDSALGGRSDRRAAIRDEAARIFAERGYNGSSLQEVADAMGFTKAAVYYYYPSKEALLFDILTYADEQVMAALAVETDRIDAADPRERVERIVAAHVSWYLHHPDIARVAFRDWGELSGDWLATQIERRRRYSHVLRNAIDMCAAKGLLSQDAPIALMANFINGAVATTNAWFDADGPESAETVARSFGRMAVAVISGPFLPPTAEVHART